MDIRNPKRLKKVAAHRLENAREAGKIVLLYSGALALSALLVSLSSHFLGQQISQTGGLGNIGTRSILSSFQSFLPLVQSLLMVAVEFGYVAAMLRIARSQYASPMSMKMGFERFWVVLRSMLLQGCIYFAACFAGFYIGSMIFAFTPLSREITEMLMPLMEQFSDPNAVIEAMDETMQLKLLEASAPMMLLSLLCCLVLVVPLSYRYRMVNYILMDKPGRGALYALRESKAMMRGNKFQLFKMDLGYWWYYGLLMLASVLCYGDILLPMAGVTLPFPAVVNYYLFYLLFLAAQVAIFWKFRNSVEVSYALAYESIRPQDPEPTQGAVLGNIFQM